MPWAAAAIAGSGIIGGITSLFGSKQASSADQQAANTQLQMYNRTAANLQPYNATGQSVLGDLSSLATSGPYGPGGTNYLASAAAAQPGQMTEAALQQTPGYQFMMNQGLQATQNSAAARGLGVSGAALKGAAQYATGLADQTYQNQFNMQQQRFQNLLNLNSSQQGNLQNQYNRLAGVASLGENAAATTGNQGTQAANAAGGYQAQTGTAQAAGTTGVGSALNSSVQNYLGYNMLRNMTGQTGGYSGSGYNNIPYSTVDSLNAHSALTGGT